MRDSICRQSRIHRARDTLYSIIRDIEIMILLTAFIAQPYITQSGSMGLYESLFQNIYYTRIHTMATQLMPNYRNLYYKLNTFCQRSFTSHHFRRAATYPLVVHNGHAIFFDTILLSIVNVRPSNRRWYKPWDRLEYHRRKLFFCWEKIPVVFYCFKISVQITFISSWTLTVEPYISDIEQYSLEQKSWQFP